ncbi:hypothetical protein EDB85DRAFT_1899085 [Lactarius pseudohatsudake]|nr:hypothetical protein EDB85DRAFT_1899085 [Lactarius pseudohatsudake]
MTPELTPNEREIVFPCPKQPGKDFRGDHELSRKNTLIRRTTGNNIPKEYLRYWEAVVPLITTLQEVMLPDYSLLHGKGYSRCIPKSTVATAPKLEATGNNIPEGIPVKTGRNIPETVPRYQETIFPYNIPIVNSKSREMIFPKASGNNIPNNIRRHRETIFPQKLEVTGNDIPEDIPVSRGIGKQYSRQHPEASGNNIPIQYSRSKLDGTGNDILEEVTGNNTPVIFPKSREMIVPWISPWHPKEHNTPTNAKQREIIFLRNTWGIGKQSSLGNPGCIGKDIPVVAAS